MWLMWPRLPHTAHKKHRRRNKRRENMGRRVGTDTPPGLERRAGKDFLFFRDRALIYYLGGLVALHFDVHDALLRTSYLQAFEGEVAGFFIVTVHSLYAGVDADGDME